MKLLLDTCTFLWIVMGSDEIPQKIKSLFQNRDNPVYLSVVSEWEIAVKYSLGRLTLPESPVFYIPKQRRKHGIDLLVLSEEDALHLVNLPLLHKDPFDRMLVSQAIVQGMMILTPDTLVRDYPARTIW